MTNEAESSATTQAVSPAASLAVPSVDEPVMLRGSGGAARVRPWPFQPTVAHLVILHQQQRLPSLADLGRWGEQLRSLGFTSVRTGALAVAAGLRVETAGYTPVQELALLAHDHPGAGAAAASQVSSARTSRLTERHLEVASAIDCAAFGSGWQLDGASVADVCRATPRHRGRLAHYDAPGDTAGDTTGPAGYAITGRDARQGFLQRLAVRPEVQGHGVGRLLVHDCLQWLARWRVQRVLVNTATDNAAALALYERAGFHRLGERLRVYERSLA